MTAPWKVLGVSENATKADVDLAFRTHNKRASDRVQKAHIILTNPMLRRSKKEFWQDGIDQYVNSQETQEQH